MRQILELIYIYIVFGSVVGVGDGIVSTQESSSMVMSDCFSLISPGE